MTQSNGLYKDPRGLIKTQRVLEYVFFKLRLTETQRVLEYLSFAVLATET
jgi:hypothetical protein